MPNTPSIALEAYEYEVEYSWGFFGIYLLLIRRFS